MKCPTVMNSLVIPYLFYFFNSPQKNRARGAGAHMRINNRMDVLPKGIQKRITIYDIGGIYGDYNLFLPGK